MTSDTFFDPHQRATIAALTGRRLDAWTRRIELVQERYVAGVEALDAAARKRGADFVDLEPDAQDEVLRAVERPEGREQEADMARSQVTLYGAPVETALQQTSAEIDLGFIPLLALHTRQGFYSDPVYGGNRDHVGWRVIGFRGPASLAEVHQGRYTTIDYFADNRVHPGTED
jgi:gluconate 2-dehydrogenase gamma chain